MDKPEKNIVIVGGGATGVSVAVQLIERFIKEKIYDYKIIIIEKEKDVGRGLAYETKFDDCILNMTYRYMSLTPDHPNQVYEWFIQNEDKWKRKYPHFDPEKDHYPPRSLYGLYMENTLLESLKLAEKHGIHVKTIEGTVIDLEEIKYSEHVIGVNVKVEGTRAISACQVVLAPGNFPPTTYKELRGITGYFPSFWPEKEVFDIVPRDATIVVLGTRLTAIDVSITLLSHGYKKIILTARKGLLPKVKPFDPIQPKMAEALKAKVEKIKKNGKIQLSELLNLFRQEIEKAIGRKIDPEEITSPAGTPISILKRDIESAKNGFAEAWQTVLVSATDIDKWWQFLSDEDKLYFTQTYVGLWYIYRSALPIKNAERVLGFLESGQIEIIPGLKSVNYNDEKECFVLDYGAKKRETHYLINATDLGIKLDEIDSPLIKNLLKRGILRPNIFGTIDMDPTTGKLIENNELRDEPIYFLGYLTRGAYFHANDMTTLILHAKKAVDNITNFVKSRREEC